MFIIINKVFFANVNSEAVASLCAILFSRSSVFVHHLLYLNAIFFIIALT